MNYIWIDSDKKIPSSQYEVMVKDEFGNEAIASPCYYPFKIEKGKVIHCEPYYGNSWLTLCDGIENKLKGDIKYWRELTDEEKQPFSSVPF